MLSLSTPWLDVVIGFTLAVILGIVALAFVQKEMQRTARVLLAATFGLFGLLVFVAAPRAMDCGVVPDSPKELADQLPSNGTFETAWSTPDGKTYVALMRRQNTSELRTVRTVEQPPEMVTMRSGRLFVIK